MNKPVRCSLADSAITRLIHGTLGVITVLLMMAWSFPAHAEMIDGIAAVVDDTVIMYSDLMKKMHDLDAKDTGITTARQVLQLMVEDVIVSKMYRNMGLPPVDPHHAEDVAKDMGIDIASAQSLIKKSTLMDFMVKSRVVVTESMVKDYYNRHKEYTGTESLHLKQILIKNDPQRAKKAIDDIRRGSPFDEAAKANSDVLVGGTPDIGWVKIEDLATEARGPLEAARQGDVVGPITLEDNILIYQIMEQGVSGGKPIDEVRDEIVETLKDKHRQEAFDHWLRMVMADHFIGIYL